MSTDEHAQHLVYKDRKGGLIFFGILHILVGSLLLICFAFALAGLAIAAAPPHADVNTAILPKTPPSSYPHH